MINNGLVTILYRCNGHSIDIAVLLYFSFIAKNGIQATYANKALYNYDFIINDNSIVKYKMIVSE